MAEAGQRDLGGGAGSTNLRVAFKDGGGKPGGGQHDRGGEAVGTGADDRCGGHDKEDIAAGSLTFCPLPRSLWDAVWNACVTIPEHRQRGPRHPTLAYEGRYV